LPLNLFKFKSYFKNLRVEEGAAANILNIFIKIIIGLLILNLSLNINRGIFIINIAI